MKATRQPGTVRLDLAALDERLREAGVKQWWLAERIRVDPKTVSRWLTGKVQRVQRETLARVAQELGCPLDALILPEAAGETASESERAAAARLIDSENLAEILAPGGRWPLLESLIKAVVQPDLPLALLGRLHLQLSIAAWRQSQLDRAEHHAGEAADFARRSGQRSLLAETTLNAATLAAFRGRLAEAVRLYESCLEGPCRLDGPVAVGKVESNLGFTTLEAGDLDAAERWQRRAIATFTAAARPYNLAIACIGLALVHLERGAFERADAALDDASAAATQSAYLRGAPDVALLRAWSCAGRGDVQAARAELARALDGYRGLGIDEGRTQRIRAHVALAAGEHEEAAAALARGRELTRDFPSERAEILEAELRLAAARDDAPLRTRVTAELTELYETLGATARLARHLGQKANTPGK